MAIKSRHEEYNDDSKDDCQYYNADHCLNNKPQCIGTSKGPVRNAGAYYTSWSFYAIFIALFVLIVSWFATQNKEGNPNKAFSYTVLPILIGLSANSIGVAFISRFLKLLPPDSSTYNILLSENWFTTHAKLDTNFHILPMFIALLILLCVTPIKWSGSRGVLILISLIVPVLMFTIWSVVPIPVSKGSKEKTNFISKPRYVYGRPSGLTEALFPIIIVLTCVMYVLVVKK